MKPDISLMPERPVVETPKRKPLTPWQLATLYLAQGGRCKKCKVKIQQGFCEDDHIIPLACGGTNDIENRQLLCPPCHSIKTNTKDKQTSAKIKRNQGIKGQRARRAKYGSQLKGRNTLSKEHRKAVRERME